VDNENSQFTRRNPWTIARSPRFSNVLDGLLHGTFPGNEIFVWQLTKFEFFPKPEHDTGRLCIHGKHFSSFFSVHAQFWRYMLPTFCCCSWTWKALHGAFFLLPPFSM
jgi:hypothetical protein